MEITLPVSKRIALKNILFLTDFSDPSGKALQYATMMARAYDSKVTALHVVVPSIYTSLRKSGTCAYRTIGEAVMPDRDCAVVHSPGNQAQIWTQDYLEVLSLAIGQELSLNIPKRKKQNRKKQKAHTALSQVKSQR